jgi:Meiotically up-regulated gene 113
MITVIVSLPNVSSGVVDAISVSVLDSFVDRQPRGTYLEGIERPTQANPDFVKLTFTTRWTGSGCSGIAKIRRWVPVVYFLQVGDDGPVKIGCTTNNVHGRIRSAQRSSPEKLNFLAAIDGGYELEAALHVYFVEKRMNGEWFDITTREVSEVIGFVLNKDFASKETEPTVPDRLQEVVRILRASDPNGIDFRSVQGIFRGRQKIFSKELAKALDYSQKQLSVELARFHIRPKDIRIGGRVRKGYLARDFSGIWDNLEV